MIFNILLFCVLCFFVLRNYVHGVILISVFSILIRWLNLPFPINVFEGVASFALVLGIIKYGKSFYKEYPFYWCFIPMAISYLATMLIIDRSFQITQLLKLSTDFLFPMALFHCLRKKSDFAYFLKCMVIFLIPLILYCIYEEFTGTNPIMASFVGNEENFSWFRYEPRFRYGFKRAQSFLCGEGAFGLCCYCFFLIIAFLKMRKSELVASRIFTYILWLLPLCVVFTGTRSVYVPFVLCCMALMSKTNIKKYGLGIIIIIGFILIAFSGFLTDVTSSITDSTGNSGVEGSDADMRELQFAAASYWMSKSPVYGNGMIFTFSLMGVDTDLFGAEGIWLPTMINRGMVGVVCLALSFLATLVVLIRRRKYPLCFFWLAFVLGKSMSTMVGIGEGYYLLILTFILCYYRYEEQEHQNQYDFRNNSSL